MATLEAQLEAVEEAMAASRAEHVQRLRSTRDQLQRLADATAAQIAKLKQTADEVALKLRDLDRQIATAESPVKPVRMSSRMAAAHAVYRLLVKSHGKRFAASELEAVANGYKVRMLVSDWNDGLTGEAKLSPIQTEGVNKFKRYFV